MYRDTFSTSTPHTKSTTTVPVCTGTPSTSTPHKVHDYRPSMYRDTLPPHHTQCPRLPSKHVQRHSTSAPHTMSTTTVQACTETLYLHTTHNVHDYRPSMYRDTLPPHHTQNPRLNFSRDRLVGLEGKAAASRVWKVRCQPESLEGKAAASRVWKVSCQPESLEGKAAASRVWKVRRQPRESGR